MAEPVYLPVIDKRYANNYKGKIYNNGRPIKYKSERASIKG